MPLLPTSTFLPTLRPQDPQSLVLDLYATNGGCKLPCWWGIEPGKSSWVNVSEFINSFALKTEKFIDDDQRLEYYSYFSVPPEIQPDGIFILAFRLNDSEIIDLIRTENQWHIDSHEYSFASLLDEFGTPDEIRVHAIATSMTGLPRYTIALFYQRLGIMAAYAGEGELLEDAIRFCPQEIKDTPQLWLWSPKQRFSFEDIARGRLIETSPAFDIQYLELEEISETSIEEFYNVYLDPSTEVCLEIILEPWY